MKGKKVKMAAVEESESEEIDEMLGEDEQAEIKEARRKAKEQNDSAKLQKV